MHIFIQNLKCFILWFAIYETASLQTLALQSFKQAKIRQRWQCCLLLYESEVFRLCRYGMYWPKIRCTNSGLRLLYNPRVHRNCPWCAPKTAQNYSYFVMPTLKHRSENTNSACTSWETRVYKALYINVCTFIGSRCYECQRLRLLFALKTWLLLRL